MPFIEGIGDEVLLVFIAVITGLVISFAWISTHVGDAPPVLIILDRNRWLQVLERFRNTIGVTVTNVNLNTEQQAAETPPAPPTETVEAPEVTQETTPIVEQRDSEGNWEDLKTQGYIRVRVKYLNEQERMLFVKPQTTIGELKRDHFQQEMSDNLAVRIVFQGQELKAEGATLSSCNVSDNSVIHIVLTRRPTADSPTPNLPQESFNIGILLVPLLAISLVLIWFFRFHYKQYFSAMATICLAGITFLFLLIAYAGYQTPARREHVD